MAIIPGGSILWPRVAKMFGMEDADPVPTSLSVYMLDKRAIP
jgi:hypothetical protein